ncbi:hypothetical protein GQ44DRAFT_766295 [Phaeosphaeriaceae sp. PMI808]|nr:hypothetical protein GQ44DRAFT_766295 [Phaeosphaeriaceae sp. PMI808]
MAASSVYSSDFFDDDIAKSEVNFRDVAQSPVPNGITAIPAPATAVTTPSPQCSLLWTEVDLAPFGRIGKFHRPTPTPTDTVSSIEPPSRHIPHRQRQHRSSDKLPQRLPHKQVEREYREGLNMELERLRRSVPTLPQSNRTNVIGSTRPSKPRVLSAAIAYIKQIERERDPFMGSELPPG